MLSGEDSGSIASPEMSETGLTVPDMNEPLSPYDVTVTVRRGEAPVPTRPRSRRQPTRRRGARSASIISAHLADKITSVVTVVAPDRYAAVAVARAVVADALKRQALSSSPSAHDHARHRAQARSTLCS